MLWFKSNTQNSWKFLNKNENIHTLDNNNNNNNKNTLLILRSFLSKIVKDLSHWREIFYQREKFSPWLDQSWSWELKYFFYNDSLKLVVQYFLVVLLNFNY